MIEFITTNFSSICLVITALAGLALTIVKILHAKSVKTTGADSDESQALKTASDTLSRVYKMLPSLVTFSETMNSNKPGVVKKDFVLNYIKQMFAMTSTDITEEDLTAISTAIDGIVEATKQMHTGGPKI